MQYSTEELEFLCESFYDFVYKMGTDSDKQFDGQITVTEIDRLIRKNTDNMPKLTKDEQKKFVYTLIAENYNFSDVLKKKIKRLNG